MRGLNSQQQQPRDPSAVRRSRPPLWQCPGRLPRQWVLSHKWHRTSFQPVLLTDMLLAGTFVMLPFWWPGHRAAWAGQQSSNGVWNALWSTC